MEMNDYIGVSTREQYFGSGMYLCEEVVSQDVFFQQQHLRKWMEVVVITHKGGQRSDGNVSDLFVSGKGTSRHAGSLLMPGQCFH